MVQSCSKIDAGGFKFDAKSIPRASPAPLGGQEHSMRGQERPRMVQERPFLRFLGGTESPKGLLLKFLGPQCGRQTQLRRLGRHIGGWVKMA